MKAIAITTNAIITHGVGSKGLRGGRGKNSSYLLILISPVQLKICFVFDYNVTIKFSFTKVNRFLMLLANSFEQRLFVSTHPSRAHQSYP